MEDSTNVVKVNQETDQEILDKFLNDKERKAAAAELAHQIMEEFPNWFTIPRMVKKFKIDTKEASGKIEILMLFSLCVGKVEKGVPYFKIDINHKTQRALICEQIAKKEGEILFLKEKLSKLN